VGAGDLLLKHVAGIRPLPTSHLMPKPQSPEQALRSRNLLFLSRPKLWAHWPFLPLVRRRPGAEEEYGVLLDALGAFGVPGFSATVVLSNLFLLPRTLDEFLALPRETFDTPEEVFDAGWCVD
jgi:hypothetical protein